MRSRKIYKNYFLYSCQKAAYDATLKAKERARLRVQAYDSKRKKFKEGILSNELEESQRP